MGPLITGAAALLLLLLLPRRGGSKGASVLVDYEGGTMNGRDAGVSLNQNPALDNTDELGNAWQGGEAYDESDPENTDL